MRVDPASRASGPRPAMRCSCAGAKPFVALFREAEARFGLPAGLAEAVARAESGLDPRAVSPAGALGLMQLMPATARAFGAQDPFDPAQNVLAGARYLRHLLDRVGGDLKLALAAYNAGPGAVRRRGGVPPCRETRRYVEKVLSLLSEAKMGEELRPSFEPRLALGEAGEAPPNFDGRATGSTDSLAALFCLAAFRLAETLPRSGEEEDGERGWRV